MASEVSGAPEQLAAQLRAARLARRLEQEPADDSAAGPHSADARHRLTMREHGLLDLVAVDASTNRVTVSFGKHMPEWRVLDRLLEALGGVWRSGARGLRGWWAFPPEVDAAEEIARARGIGEVFDPRRVGYYPTPDDLADGLVAPLAIRAGDRVLEPSGGEGALARAMRRACPEARIICVDVVKSHAARLREQGFETVAGDFLKLGAEQLGPPFDVVVMNPPFGRRGRQRPDRRPEILHVWHALGLLKAGGRLGAILPSSLLYRKDWPTVALRAELSRLGAVVEPNPRRAFKASGIEIDTVSVWCTVDERLRWPVASLYASDSTCSGTSTPADAAATTYDNAWPFGRT